MKYVAFFRALNVGKSNRIKSADLKILFENVGAFNIHIILQSGNVIFETANLLAFKTHLESELSKIIDTPVYWVIYSADQFESLWKGIEKLKTDDLNGSWIQVLLSEKPNGFGFQPSEVDVELTQSPTWVVYHPKGVSKSNLKVKNLFEQSPNSTFRNYNTLLRVYNRLLSV